MRALPYCLQIRLTSDDLRLAQHIGQVIMRKAGPETVKAASLCNELQGPVWIELVVEEFRDLSIKQALDFVKIEARKFHVEIAATKIVGPVPMEAVIASFEEYIQLESFRMHQILTVGQD